MIWCNTQLQNSSQRKIQPKNSNLKTCHFVGYSRCDSPVSTNHVGHGDDFFNKYANPSIDLRHFRFCVLLRIGNEWAKP